MRSRIIPNRHNENHTTAQSFPHLLEASTESELILVTGCFLLCGAEVRADRIVLFALEVKLRRLNDFAILNILSANFDKIASVCVITCNELSDDGKGLGCIYSKAGAIAKECFLSKAVSIQIASGPVTETTLAAILFVFAALGSIKAARMSSVSRCLAVGLPNIHFCATCPILARGRR